MSKESKDVGFTLIEIIATIVLFGLVAVMGVSFFSSGVTRTDIPVTQLQADAHLQLVLENMIADTASGTTNSNLQTFYTSVGAIGSSPTTYGNGSSYYIANKGFVCPDASNVFVANASAYQFLLVTIKANANSGPSLSYLFSSNSASANCTVGGS